MANYKIPDIVKSYCEGYKVKYKGKYQGKNVYSVDIVDDDFPDAVPCTGYPCYVLWDPENPEGIEQVSDTTMEITDAVSKKKRSCKDTKHLEPAERLP